MKKHQWLSLLLCFCLCLLPLGGIAYAADPLGDGYSFSNGTLTITSNGGTTNWRDDKNIATDDVDRYEAINTIVLGESVTTIGNFAFFGCNKLTSVTFPANLKTIGGDAFSRCSSLANVTFPAKLTSIGKNAFYYCRALTSVDLSNCTSLTTIGQQAFDDCRALTSVDLSNCTSLTTIGGYAFRECRALTAAKFPPSLTTLGEMAFYDCVALTSVDLSGCTSLTTIGLGAFENCRELAAAKFPPSLTSIEQRAFYYCPKLSELYFYGNNPPSLGADAFANTPATKTLYCPIGQASSYTASAFGATAVNATLLAPVPEPDEPGSKSSPFFTPDNGDRWVVIDPGQHGAVSPAGGYLQGDVTFTVSPNAGWRGDYALIDGKTKVEIVDNAFTLTITEPLRIQIFYIAGEEVPLVVTPPATTPTTPPITANPQTGDSLLAGLF